MLFEIELIYDKAGVLKLDTYGEEAEKVQCLRSLVLLVSIESLI